LVDRVPATFLPGGSQLLRCGLCNHNAYRGWRAKFSGHLGLAILGDRPSAYHYEQPKFGAPPNCADPVSTANGHGTFDAVSLAVDWQFAEKFDAYAGFMFSQVSGGLANGFLYRSTIDPAVGLRFRF